VVVGLSGLGLGHRAEMNMELDSVKQP
jgi:hypothetical protein